MQKDIYLLGVDGGGTRSTAVIADASGHVLARSIGETINYYSIGMERAQANFRRIVADLPNRYISRIDQTCIGMSALDHHATAEEAKEFTKDILPSGSVQMISDSYIALMALTRGKPGIIVISGTGSVALAQTADNRMVSVGGWGHLLGDQGSAYDIALNGIRAAIQSYERFIEESELTGRLKRYFAIHQMHELTERFYHPVMERHLVAGFASEVSACAEDQDTVAKRIIDEAVRVLARHAEVLIERWGLQSSIVGVSGGLFQNNPYVFESFKERLLQQYPRLTVTFPAVPPEIGALLYCFEARNMQPSDELVNRLAHTYSLL